LIAALPPPYDYSTLLSLGFVLVLVLALGWALVSVPPYDYSTLLSLAYVLVLVLALGWALVSVLGMGLGLALFLVERQVQRFLNEGEGCQSQISQQGWSQ
jgi:hypothetical protein